MLELPSLLGRLAIRPASKGGGDGLSRRIISGSAEPSALSYAWPIGHQGDNHHHYAPATPSKPVVDDRFENIIKINPPSSFQIRTRVEDQHSRNFTGEFGAILVRNGWKARDTGYVQSRAFDGVILCGNREALKSPDAAILVEAFKAIGVTLKFETKDTWPIDSLRIDVGTL
ncbi:hypothetical protein [Sphingomonas sp.]|uniref:hypothetical protein n=1 Tax=Sphingomonadales TaxID=204457 RepID=UPI0035C800F3